MTRRLRWGDSMTSSGHTVRPALLVAAAAMLLVAACGTTVSDSQAARRQGSASAGADIGGGTSGGVDNGGAGPTPGSTSGIGAGSTAGATGTGLTASGPGAASNRATGLTHAAPGVPLKLGIEILDYGNAALVLGIAENAPTKQQYEGEYQAVIDRINASGGLLGHKLEPVFALFQATSSAPGAQQDQATCAAFTQDNHVFAALVIAFHTDTLLGCLNNAGVLTIDPAGVTQDDAVLYQIYPNLFSAGQWNLTRLAPVYVDRLLAQHYFATGSRIGVIYIDTPPFRRAYGVLQSALKQHGLTVTDSAASANVDSVNSYGSAGGPIANAVLRFHSQQIDHVIFLDNGIQALVFTNAAASQGYKPRYGISTQDLSALIGAPGTQLDGSVGPSWYPAADLGPNPPATTAPQQSCDSLMKARGLPAGGFAWQVCDHVNALAAFVTAAGGLSPAAVTGALARVRFEAASLFASSYGPDRRDGVAAARDVAYNSRCSCFKYTSSTYGV